jgi:hypothetical protein
MISIDSIRKRALQHYELWLSEIVLGNHDYQILVIDKRLADRKKDLLSRADALDQLKKWSKTLETPGYIVQLESPSVRSKKTESTITAILFKEPTDLLYFLGKEAEFTLFQQQIKDTTTLAPHLLNWCAQNTSLVIKHALKWNQLLEVVQYFIENDPPYPSKRLLPFLQSDSKFVEQNNQIVCALLDHTLPSHQLNSEEKKFEKRYQIPDFQPQISCYWNDPILIQYYRNVKALTFQLDDFSENKISEISKVIVVENKNAITKLLQFELPNTCIIMGNGFAAELLSAVNWLNEIKLYYWGDIDTQGLVILSRLKHYFPHLQPLMMHIEVMHAHKKYHTKGKQNIKNIPLNLSVKEQELFAFLKKYNLRLEQERIENEYVKSVLKNIVF